MVEDSSGHAYEDLKAVHARHTWAADRAEDIWAVHHAEPCPVDGGEDTLCAPAQKPELETRLV